jgi:hypothetical protein
MKKIGAFLIVAVLFFATVTPTQAGYGNKCWNTWQPGDYAVVTQKLPVTATVSNTKVVGYVSAGVTVKIYAFSGGMAKIKANTVTNWFKPPIKAFYWVPIWGLKSMNNCYPCEWQPWGNQCQWQNPCQFHPKQCWPNHPKCNKFPGPGKNPPNCWWIQT